MEPAPVSPAAAAVAAFKESEINASNVIIAVMADRNPADVGLVASLEHHKILGASAFAEKMAAALPENKASPTEKHAKELIALMESTSPVWHGLDVNKFLGTPEYAVRPPEPAPSLCPIGCEVCPLGCPHGPCGGGEWVLCAACYGFYCATCGAPRSAGLWPACYRAGLCRPWPPLPPSPEVGIDLCRLVDESDAPPLSPAPLVPGGRGVAAMTRFAKRVHSSYADISARANAAAQQASVDAATAAQKSLAQKASTVAHLRDGHPTSYVTPPAGGPRPAFPRNPGFGDITMDIDTDPTRFGPGANPFCAPDAPRKSRDIKSVIRENIKNQFGGKSLPSSLDASYLWPLFSEAILADPPSVPSFELTHPGYFAPKRPPHSVYLSFSLMEWLQAFFAVTCGQLGCDVLSMFAGCGTVADEINARVDGDGANMRVGMNFVSIVAFYQFILGICTRGEADDGQFRQLLVRVIGKLARMLARRHPTDDRLYCSPRDTLLEIMLSDLELPPPVVAKIPAALPSIKGGGRGGGVSLGGRGGGGTARGSGSRSVTFSGDGARSAPKNLARRLPDDDGEDERPGPRRRTDSGKSVARAMRAVKISDFYEDDDEPEEYDQTAWGGNAVSKMGCYAMAFDKEGCCKEDCQWSHRPSVVFAIREKKRREKGWGQPKSNPRFDRGDGNDDDEE